MSDDETIYLEQHVPSNVENTGCLKCGDPEIEEGYQFQLCSNCRDELSKRPIPFWIKCMTGVTVLVLLFALTKFPASINAGIEFEKGIKAEKEAKYLTAMRAYDNVVSYYPDSMPVLERLFVSEYYNGRIGQAYQTLEKIADKEATSEEAATEINEIINKLDSYYYFTSQLLELIQAHGQEKPDKLAQLLQDYLEENPNDVMAEYYLANSLFDMRKFDDSEQLMSKTLSTHQDFSDGCLFMAAICREKGHYDKAIEMCKNVLTSNTEYAPAYVSLSKVELKRNNDKKGLEYAIKAYELDRENSNIVANLSLAYHYNNMVKERDDAFKQFKDFNDNNKYDLDLLTSIYSGDLKWRQDTEI